MCDVWCVMCDVWCVMCDVWCMMCDVWCVMCDIWCMMCDVMCDLWSCVLCDVWRMLLNSFFLLSVVVSHLQRQLLWPGTVIFLHQPRNDTLHPGWYIQDNLSANIKCTYSGCCCCCCCMCCRCCCFFKHSINCQFFRNCGNAPLKFITLNPNWWSFLFVIHRPFFQINIMAMLVIGTACLNHLFQVRSSATWPWFSIDTFFSNVENLNVNWFVLFNRLRNSTVVFDG